MMHDPLSNYAVGWDWNDHRAHKNPATGQPYLGGRDSKAAVGTRIAAAADGVVSRVGTLQIQLEVNAALRINYREVIGVKFGRVQEGDIICHSTRLWPHMDATVRQPNGSWLRVPIESVMPHTVPTTPTAPIVIPNPDPMEDEEMKNVGIWFTRSDGALIVAIVNTGSGYYSEHMNGKTLNGTYNTQLAKTFGVTEDFMQVTESHANTIKTSCANVRAGIK